MDIAYTLFMAEAENRFPDQRKRSIEQAIIDLVNCYNAGYNVYQSFDSILKTNNLKNASKHEIQYITDQFNERID